MKKHIVFVTLFVLSALAVNACAAPATPTLLLPSPTAIPSATAVPPTATRVPPTATATPTPPTATPVPLTLKEMAAQVADKLGKVMRIVEGDPKRVVFVFEEMHNSTLGQIEIAAMLNRLYEKHGLRHIGLEGYFPENGPLKLAWAHAKPYFQAGQKITAREDVIAYTLRAGEISSAEFIGLIYADVVVDGIDDAKLYAVEYSRESGNALGEYLFQIAYRRLSNADRSTYQSLVNQKKGQEAFFFVIGADKFTAEADARFRDQSNFISPEESLELLDRIEAEAQKVGVTLPPTYQANLNLLRNFWKTVSQRSDTFVARLLKTPTTAAPIATTVGAAHTSRMVDLLTQAGVSVAVIRPRSLAETDTTGLLSAEAFERKKKGQSVAPAGYLGALLEGRRKPPPVADGEAYRRQLHIKTVTEWLAREAEFYFRQGDSSAMIKQTLSERVRGEGDQFLSSAGPGLGLSWMGIERVEITKVEQIRLSGALWDTPEFDRVRVDFKIVFKDPTSWAGAGIEIAGTVWAGKGPQYVPITDHLLGMADNLRKETVPSSSVSSPMPRPEQISSTTQVFWIGILAPDIIAALNQAALAQAQARLADARVKGEVALINADYAQKAAAAAQRTVAAWQKQREDADAAAARAAEAQAQADAAWAAAYRDEVDARKRLDAANLHNSLQDAANYAKFELANARANLDAARAQADAAERKRWIAWNATEEARRNILRPDYADALARAEEAEKQANADYAAAKKALAAAEATFEEAERRAASTREQALKAGVNPDGPRVDTTQAAADLKSALERQQAASKLQLETRAENRAAQERAAAIKQAEDAARADAKRLAEEAERAKDAANAAVEEFRKAKADYDRLQKKSP